MGGGKGEGEAFAAMRAWIHAWRPLSKSRRAGRGHRRDPERDTSP